jgi:hypothetical protein
MISFQVSLMFRLDLNRKKIITFGAASFQNTSETAPIIFRWFAVLMIIIDIMLRG